MFCWLICLRRDYEDKDVAGSMCSSSKSVESQHAPSEGVFSAFTRDKPALARYGSKSRKNGVQIRGNKYRWVCKQDAQWEDFTRK